MRRTSTKFVMLLLLALASAACSPAEDSSSSEADTNIQADSIQSDAVFTERKPFLKANYVKQWHDTYPASLPPASPDRVSNVLQQINKNLLGGWHAELSENLITIFREEPASYYMCTQMDARRYGEHSYLEKLVAKYNYKGRYEIKALLTRQVSRIEYAAIEKNNQPCWDEYKHQPGLPDFFEVYLSAHPACAYRPPPQYFGNGFSVFVTDSAPIGTCVYPEQAEQERWAVQIAFRKLFKNYGELGSDWW